MSRRLMAVLCVAALPQAGVFAQQPRDVRPAIKLGTATLAGMVVSDETPSRPLKRTNIAILGTDDAQIRLTMTDDAGRFIMPALAAGRYLVTATKPPYIDTVYGARLPGRPGTPILLKEGEQRTNLVLKMIRGAAITGVVTDENGQPAAGVNVELIVPRTRPGDRMMADMLMAVSSMLLPRQITDDRGVYRFSGLPPGEYIVSATPVDLGGGEAALLAPDAVPSALREIGEAPRTPSSPAQNKSPTSTVINPEDRPQRPITMSGSSMMNFSSVPMPAGVGAAPGGPTIGYAPVYHPGTTNPAEALVIAVGAGEERMDVDIVARPVPTTRIDGVVFGPDGQPAPNVRIQIRGEDRLETLASMMTSLARSISSRSDGAFTLTGVAPGRYTIQARRAGNPAGMPPQAAPPASEQALWAAAEIVADGSPITGLDLTLQPGLTISGRVVLETPTRTTPPDVKTINVAVGPARVMDLAMLGGGAARVAADGTFTIAGLTPGTYKLTGQATGQGPLPIWLDASVIVDGREVSDLPFDLRPGGSITDAVVTLTDRQQDLSGTLQDASGRPATEYTMVLFPADKAYWLPGSRRILTARPATDGHFAFRGLQGPPPGAYLLAAVTDLRPSEQYDPGFLTELAKESIKLIISPGETKTQDVRLVK